MNIQLFEMATEAYKTCLHIPNLKIPKGFVEHLANAIAAEEREACAKVCESFDLPLIAEAIRERGQ
jgi:6,7-dimethyl-8-ribityllumazine synthase